MNWFVHKPNQIDCNWKIMEHDEIAGATIAVLDGRCSPDELKANARLISAAPELLEALEYFLNNEQTSKRSTAINKAINAIAKAKGKSA